jgi:hypothetical protein
MQGSGRKLMIRLIGVAVVAAVVVAWASFRTTVPVIDQLTADRLLSTADKWCKQSPSRKIPPNEWTKEVRHLRPQSVWTTPDGVYIERGSRFVESWGVFVHRSRSTFRPSPGTDPGFRPIQGRVYWYEIKG